MRVRHAAIAALLVVVTVAAYWPAIQSGFIWDDDCYVINNEVLRSVEGLGRIWFDIGATQQYYPLTYTSFWLEFRFWGADPTGYHVVNVLLHALTAVMLWRVLRMLKVPGAVLAAAVFALHPVHVESVAWITERKNILSAFLYMAALLAWLHHRERSDKGPMQRLYALSMVLFVGALLSKTVACSLPAVLLLVIWWQHGRITPADVRGLLPFFAVGVGLGLLTVWLERHDIGPWARTGTCRSSSGA